MMHKSSQISSHSDINRTNLKALTSKLTQSFSCFQFGLIALLNFYLNNNSVLHEFFHLKKSENNLAKDRLNGKKMKFPS